MTIKNKRKAQAKFRKRKFDDLWKNVWSKSWSGLTTVNHLQYLYKCPLTPQEMNKEYKWEIMKDNDN